MRPAWLLLAVLALAGCGTTVIDAAEGERFITRTVEEQLGATVESVECPEDLEAERGASFECTVTGTDGTSGEVTVDQTDDEGSVTVAAAPFIRVRSLEEQITTGIQEQTGFDAQVDCPEITEFERGNAFECQTMADGESRAVLVTQKDAEGNVRYEFK